MDARTIEQRLPADKRGAFRARFEAMAEADRPVFLANIEKRLPPVDPPEQAAAITPEEAAANFRAKWGMTSAEYFAQECERTIPGELHACRDCTRFTPNPRTPRFGLGTCDLREPPHPERGQWPNVEHPCKSFKQEAEA